MKSFAPRLALCGLLVGLLGVGGAQAQTITITTEEFPPLNFSQGGEITGISTEVVRKALEETKVDGKIVMYPWARAYDMALKDPNTCVYSTTRTEEREPNFKWIGPIANNQWLLLGRPDSPKVASLDEVKKYVVGGYKADALTDYLKAQGLTVEEAASDDLNPKKLKAGRIDYWASYKFEGQGNVQKPGADGLVEMLNVKTVSLYLACNKAISDEIVSKLNTSIKKMADDGTVAAIAAKYK